MSAAAATAIINDRNRANAKHSTGPKTAEGKAASSRNSTRHGLTGRLHLETADASARFDARLAEYTAFYKLAHPDTAHFVRELVTAEFRLEAIRATRDNVLAILAERYHDEIDESFEGSVHERIAGLAYLRDIENGGVLARLHRYEHAAQRAWNRAHTELERLAEAQSNPFSAFSLQEMNAPNEPSQPPIGLGTLPSFPDVPDLAVSLPPEILNMLRDPKRRR